VLRVTGCLSAAHRAAASAFLLDLATMPLL
jgi:hypothetical protein